MELAPAHLQCSPHSGRHGVLSRLNRTVFISPPEVQTTCHVQGPDKKEFRLENLDVVLMATGRHPNTKNIGLEQVSPAGFRSPDCPAPGDRAGFLTAWQLLSPR